MKQIFKLTVSVLLIACMCLTLCSCSYLDELREEQAYYTNEDADEIIYQDITYKFLSLHNYEDIYQVNYTFNETHTQKDIKVAHKDMPLLIAASFSDDFYFPYYKNSNILLDEYQNLYVKKSLYDEYDQMIKRQRLGNYCLEVTDEYGYYQSYKKISEEGARILDDIVENAPVFYSPESTSYTTVATVYDCDADVVMLCHNIVFEEDDLGNYSARIPARQKTVRVPDEYYYFIDNLKAETLNYE